MRFSPGLLVADVGARRGWRPGRSDEHRRGHRFFPPLVDLLAVHGDVAGCLDADAGLIADDLGDRDADVVADHDAFADLAGEHEHVLLPLGRLRVRHLPYTRSRDISGEKSQGNLCLVPKSYAL